MKRKSIIIYFILLCSYTQAQIDTTITKTSKEMDNKTMKITQLESKLEKILTKSINNKEIFGGVVNIESGDNTFSWSGSGGNIKEEN